ncbi:dTDP-4-dehydrorhamnose 3,5-epimerase [Devosia beringensis]|uniref:dTDP-4-dehydrorhamnose 3,5-epimerase n=1 Tax=Devosia beringensis TaxID=2657486 RepID=UPI00186B6E1E|nr:dTDP-4-dehydrorhamnose 3,5-epimerase [Devosia beringensis]
MIFHETTLQDAKLIDIEPRADDRGMFARTMCRDEFLAHGIDVTFVQQNMSISAKKGTLRGMHLQLEPYGEDKFIRCVKGAIHDIIIDMRPHSPTYRRHEGFELTARNFRELFVPRGFAHGFLTLSDDAEVSYLVSSPYHPGAEIGLRYDDPALALHWPAPISTISDKDRSWPLLAASEPVM